MLFDIVAAVAVVVVNNKNADWTVAAPEFQTEHH